ncbi:MAG: DUF4417 domain-containing protein [Bifidobacteriaceae bacterium]|jgi:hypothetical protein|nr:DUF4417 domain-containing protein [Bifidobacteriaceae bacterium]
MGEVRGQRLEWYSDQSLPSWGRYDMPMIEAQDVALDGLTLIRYTSSGGDAARAGEWTVHFFEEDSRFDEVWHRPEAAVDRLARYRQVLSPDFSLWIDRPVVEQIANTWRNRWCGAFWQKLGLTVIPTISWGDGRSFDFCFEGVETGAVVAVSTLGARDSRGAFMRGYRQMMRAIEPRTVVCYADPFEEMALLGPVVVVPYSPNTKTARRLSLESRAAELSRRWAGSSGLPGAAGAAHPFRGLVLGAALGVQLAQGGVFGCGPMRHTPRHGPLPPNRSGGVGPIVPSHQGKHPARAAGRPRPQLS